MACKAKELPQGKMKQVEAEGHPPVLVYHLEDGFYATDDTCTHGFASLAEGYIEDGLIECPWHGGTFEIRTGKPASFPCVVPLKSYPVKVEGEEVYIVLEET